MRLNSAEVDRCLAALRAMGAAHRFTDTHVHPFEVFYGPGRYAPNASRKGVWSSGNQPYAPPMAAAFDLEASLACDEGAPAAIRQRMALLCLRRLYLHTGPQTFRDQMSLGGISRALLLPVVRPGGDPEEEMAILAAMFGADPLFLLGYCLPAGLADDQIEAHLCQAIRRWDIRALKVHPNLTGLDLATEAGKQQLEAILAGAGEAGLPVILHGGASPDLHPSPASRYGLLENLEEIDFHLCRQPVVIAHAGAFGADPQEVAAQVLPRLERLLARFDHLLVDLSALPAGVLAQVVSRVDPDRCLFGSDALYEVPWKALVRLFAVLQMVTGGRCEEVLIKIAGKNPERLFEKESREDDCHAAHQVSPVS